MGPSPVLPLKICGPRSNGSKGILHNSQSHHWMQFCPTNNTFFVCVCVCGGGSYFTLLKGIQSVYSKLCNRAFYYSETMIIMFLGISLVTFKFLLTLTPQNSMKVSVCLVNRYSASFDSIKILLSSTFCCKVFYILGGCFVCVVVTYIHVLCVWGSELLRVLLIWISFIPHLLNWLYFATPLHKFCY